jgi:hypothetical protein
MQEMSGYRLLKRGFTIVPWSFVKIDAECPSTKCIMKQAEWNTEYTDWQQRVCLSMFMLGAGGPCHDSAYEWAESK